VAKAAVVGAQVFAVLWVNDRHPDVLRAIVRDGALTSPRLSIAAWVSFAVAVPALAALFASRRTKVEHGLMWAAVAVFLGVRSGAADALFVYCGAAGLILLFAVLEHGYDIAYRDELTGLPSRRAFNDVIGQMGGAYAIALCDVDHFKRFNDSYGHDAGDQLLKLVALRLSEVGGGGRAFRYGGEEFLIVFRGRSAREAEPFAEFLRQAVAGIHIVPRGETVSVSISIGIGEKSKRHSTPELVLEAADTAMYRAKESGRNCVRIAEGTPA
jgi:diguanylate cyclase (GGDEF)-like protein